MIAYNVVAGDTVGLAPGAHDVGVVVGQDGNDVDALGAQLRKLLDVLGDVVGGADGGEGTCRAGWRSVREAWDGDGYNWGGKEEAVTNRAEQRG